MATWNPRANELFLKAMELRSSEGRRALLDRDCGADLTLRAEVEQLLEASDLAGSFLGRPAVEVGITAVARQSGDVAAAAVGLEAAGAVIGPYKLLQQIGEGGMGTVYMAEQTQPVRRKLALKVIKPGMDSRQVIARFEAERQALAMMDHVNIARVFDAGTTLTGLPYFVMELVHGVPITNYCDDNQLTPRQRLELFVPVCQAIQHAHQKGIIHRDIKPSNVMITLYDGKPVPKVIDFGVAKATEQKLTERTLFTQYGTLVGTLEYMSPEQAEMSALGVDTRSDIFSLGVLLYELLTGNTPLSHKRVREAAYGEILRLIKEEEPPRPSTRLSESGEALASISAQRHMEPARLTKLVKGELDWIVMKTLEKDRNRRYETVSGFARDIQRYLADEAVEACPPSAGYKLRKFARTNRKLLSAMTAIGTLLVVATIGAVMAAVQSGRLAEKEQELRSTAEHRADEEARARHELDKRLYANRIALAQQELYAQNTGRAQELLDECPALLRGWEWYFLERFRPGNPLNTQGGGRSAAFSPDGRYLACGRDPKNVDLIDPATGRKIRSFGGITTSIDLYALAFWPKAGESIVAAGDYDGKVVKLWNADTGQELPTLGGHALRLRTVAFSPDGQQLAVGCFAAVNESGGSRVWDWRRAQVVFELPRRLGISRLAYSPDGRHLAAAVWGNEKDVIIYEAATGKEIRSFGKHHAGIEGLAYSPNGRRLATCGEDGNVKIWDEATGELMQTLRGHVGPVKDVVYTPDGRRLASAGWDKTVKIWDAESGEELLTLRGHTDIVMKLAFSPNGHLLVSVAMDTIVKVWNATPAGEVTDSEAISVPGHTSVVRSVAFSPDGRLLASAGTDRLIKVWDAASLGPGIEPKGFTLRADADTDMSLAFSPDSRHLASAGEGASLKVWDMVTAQAVLTVSLQAAQTEGGNEIRSIAYSPDGRRLASLGPGALAVRDATTGETLKVVGIPSGDLFGLAYSPDGRHVATCRQHRIMIWDAETGKEVYSFAHSQHVWRVAYSPNGRHVAAACFDQTIKIWDTTNRKELRTLRGHTDRVTSVAFSPDGKRLASGSGDSTVKVWDAASGQELATFRGHTGHVWSVAFSPDGKRLSSAGGHGTNGEVKVWDLASISDVGEHPEEVEKARRQTIEFYEMLATAQPKVWEHRRNLGHAYARQGQWDKAINEYAKAVEVYPAILGELAASLEEKGRNGEVVELLDKLAAAHPTRAYFPATAGRIYGDLGRWDEAIAWYRKAIEIDPKYVYAYRMLVLPSSVKRRWTRQSRAIGRPSNLIRNRVSPGNSWDGSRIGPAIGGAASRIWRNLAGWNRGRRATSASGS